jgi:hypothetical protein
MPFREPTTCHQLRSTGAESIAPNSARMLDERESYTHRSQRFLYVFGQILIGDNVMDRSRGHDP